jgi:hypothetical protein
MDTPSGREISKNHCTFHFIRRMGAEYWIAVDARSRNGTFVNGTKIHRQKLRPNDEILFGAGPDFVDNDQLVSTEGAFCRYRFLIPDPIVKLTNLIDPNSSLPPLNPEDMCSICYEPMVAPETLACGHRFCLVCIRTWAQVRLHTYQSPICPVCRAHYRLSDIHPGEAILSERELKIWTVEPILRNLGILSCKTINGANIFKEWSEKHRKWFWYAFEKVTDHEYRRPLFLHLAKASIPHITAASESEARRAMANFGLEVSEDRDENVRKLLLFICEHFLPVPPSPRTQGRSARRVVA